MLLLWTLDCLSFHHLICCPLIIIIVPDASAVHATDSGQLQAILHVAGQRFFHGKPTRRAVTTMESNDLVIGDDHLFGPSCQQYNWQTGCLFRRGKAYFKPPLSCGRIQFWKRLQEIILRTNQECGPYRRFDVNLWPLSGIPVGEGNPLQIGVGCPHASGS